MLRRYCLLLLIQILVAAILTGWNSWEQKPFLEWSAVEADRMLNDSPWIALKPLSAPRGLQPPSPFPLNLRMVLLSAQPVREAYLRRLSFPQDVQSRPDFLKTVRVEEINPKSEVEESQARLQRFIASNPEDIRVRGDDRHIVVAITVTQFLPPYAETSEPSGRLRRVEPPRAHINRQVWREDPHPDFLMGLTLSSWVGKTFLSTNAGKRLGVVRYDAPGRDQLGAKLYFPRKLPDGSPLVTPEDKELRFETQIAGKKIRMKFDLRKMVYKGRLEV